MVSNIATAANLPVRPTIKQPAEFQRVDQKTFRFWIAQDRLTAYHMSVPALGRPTGGAE